METEFTFRLDDGHGGNEADGIAFVLHSSPDGAAAPSGNLGREGNSDLLKVFVSKT